MGDEATGYDRERAEAVIEAALVPLVGSVSKGLDTTADRLPPRKYGLVMSGGGAMGVYEAGVLQAFALNGFHFDVLVGTSIGSINAAVYAEYSRRLRTALNLPAEGAIYEPPASYLQHFLLFWEYVDQAQIINFNYPPVYSLIRDLRRLDVQIGQLANLWWVLTDAALDKDSKAGWVRRFLANIHRRTAFLGLAFALGPDILQSLLRPGDDLYDALRKGLTASGAKDVPDETAASGNFSQRLRPILRTTLMGHYTATSPLDPILKSLFTNQSVVSILRSFPPVVLDEHSPPQATAIVGAPQASPAVTLPPYSFADYEREAGVMLRFPRSNARTGQLEVSAHLRLEDAVLDTLAWLNGVLDRPSQTMPELQAAANPRPLRATDDDDEMVMVAAAQAVLAEPHQPLQAEVNRLLDEIITLETQLAFKTTRDGLRLYRSRFVVGNPDTRAAVLASSALQTVLPPVTIDVIYPLTNPVDRDDPRNDPDNAALRELQMLSKEYLDSQPPHSQGEQVNSLSPTAVAHWTRRTMKADLGERMTQLQRFARMVLTCLPVRQRRVSALDLLRCIVASWHTYYPLLFSDADVSYREEYNDGGSTDVTPLGNAIDGLRTYLRDLRTADDQPAIKQFLQATHQVYFIHLADIPQGIRLTPTGEAVLAEDEMGDPTTRTRLQPQEMNELLSYEYGLRHFNISQQAKYVSDASNARRIKKYIDAIKALQEGRGATDHQLDDADLININVVNVYPDEMLTSLLGFDRRTGYNHERQRRMIAMGCSNTMETLWREAERSEEPDTGNRSVPEPVAQTLRQKWLTPVTTAEGHETLYCHNYACMYRAECKLTKTPPTPEAAGDKPLQVT